MVSLLIAATPLLINQGSPPAMTSAQFALPPLCLALIGMVVAFLYRCAFPFELIEPWTDWLPP
jgi:hypothetical protein